MKLQASFLVARTNYLYKGCFQNRFSVCELTLTYYGESPSVMTGFLCISQQKF